MITFKQKWFKESMRMIIPMFGGLSFAVVMTIMCAKPTKWTFMWWGITYVILFASATLAGYISAKRK